MPNLYLQLLGYGYNFQMLISTSGTRFPRAVREPPRRKRLRGLPSTRFSRRSFVPYVPINFVLTFRWNFFCRQQECAMMHLHTEINWIIMTLPTIFICLYKVDVDSHSRHSLSAGGPGASSAQAPAGSLFDALFPQESRTFRSNQLCFNI